MLSKAIPAEEKAEAVCSKEGEWEAMWFEGWNLEVLSRTGAWLVFGIILLPLYGMLLGWFLGKPRQLNVALMGVGYLVGVTVAVWVGLAAFVAVLGLVFF